MTPSPATAPSPRHCPVCGVTYVARHVNAADYRVTFYTGLPARADHCCARCWRNGTTNGPATPAATPAQPAAPAAASWPAFVPAPACDGQQPGEGWSAYGRRALLHALTHDASYTLDDAGLDAAADFASVAVGAPDMAPTARGRIVTVQSTLRSLLARRRATAAAIAALTPADGAIEAVAGSQTPAQGPAAGGTGGGGGSKVPRVPKPQPKGPAPAAVLTPRRPVPATLTVETADPF